MRIACVDKTATDRLKLEEILSAGFRECRKTIGHILVSKFFPSSREQALVNSPPDVVVLGPGLTSDEAFAFVREWSSLHQDTPVFMFCLEERYSFKLLNRFEPYVREIFTLSDKASRYVYSISSTAKQENKRSKGSLVTVEGVKGGVGVTSITAGLAHAYQELGKSAVVVDLSSAGVFCQFMLADKWQSSEFSEILSQKRMPDTDKVERLLVSLKNGIKVLPPPSGGGEARELFLRNVETLDISLYLIDRLLEIHDVVIVDMAGSEGIFPFALTCRSDCRMLISGNDAGSVHLLGSKISGNHNIGDGLVFVVLNSILQSGLGCEDVLDFISWVPGFEENMLYREEVPYNSKAALWMGTGNTIYTEGNAKLKNMLVTLANASLGLTELIPARIGGKQKYLNMIPSRKKAGIGFRMLRRLPLLTEAEPILEVQLSSVILPMDRQASPALGNTKLSDEIDSSNLSEESRKVDCVFHISDHLDSSPSVKVEDFDYTPPKKVVNE